MGAGELFDLSGRVALVTGASSGLGAGFARTLSGAGAAVVLVARRVERLAALEAEIARSGGRAFAVAADVHDRTAMARAFEAAERAFGCVTVLVNNAGVAQQAVRAIEFGRRGITANVVSPGATDTEMLRAANPGDTFEDTAARTALRRLGQPGDIAAVVAFLAGPDSGWISGQNLAADGGLLP